MSTDVHERHAWLTAQEIALELRVDVASVYRASGAATCRRCG